MNTRAILIAVIVIAAGYFGYTYFVADTGMEETPVADLADTGDVPEYSADTLFATTSYGLAGGRAFSPDMSRVLVASDASGVFNAYALPVDGGAPEQLTSRETTSIFSAVSYFPADDRVLVSFDEGGNERNHIYVREADGTLTDLTPGADVKAAFARWEEGGAAFYITTNERNSSFFDLYRYETDGYAREMVFENTGGYSIGGVSPDGQWAALALTHSNADSDIYLVNLAEEGGEPQLITEHEGDISYGISGFSHDGSRLYYTSNEGYDFQRGYAYDLEAGTHELIAERDWDIFSVSDSSTGAYRVIALNEEAATTVEILDAETGEPVGLQSIPEGLLTGMDFSDDDSHLALTVNTDTSPSDVYVIDIVADEATRLTNALNPEVDEDHLVAGEHVYFESYDGLEIPGILYRPHGASADNPVPAIVWVHGGPGGQSRHGYNPALQHLVNHGYAVFAINNRGSSGYGKEFFHMDDRAHGEADLDDVVWSKAFLAGHDWINGDQVAILGGSYGGYMVAAALAFRPDVFDAGIDIFGVTNWVRTLTSIPDWWESFKKALYDEMGDPATDAERHRAISPLFHADNITRPLLVVQGANDPRVLQVESDELVEAVRANGVPVEYIVFPDEGHGFRNKANRIRASEAYVDFLDLHLKGVGEAASGGGQ